MTPLDAMLPGPRARLDGARTAGEPALPAAGSGFDAVLGGLEARDPAGSPESGATPAEPAAPAAARPAGLGMLLPGPGPATARPGATDLAALMERAAGRPTALAADALTASAAGANVGAPPAAPVASPPTLAAAAGSMTPAADATASAVPPDPTVPSSPRSDGGSDRANAARPRQGAAVQVLAPRRDASVQVLAPQRDVSVQVLAPRRDASPDGAVPDASAAAADENSTIDADAAQDTETGTETDLISAPAETVPFVPVAWPVRPDLAAVPGAAAAIGRGLRSVADAVSHSGTAGPLPAVAQAAAAQTVPGAAPASAAVVVAQETHFAPVPVPTSALSSGPPTMAASSVAATPASTAVAAAPPRDPAPIQPVLPPVAGDAAPASAASPSPAVPVPGSAGEPNHAGKTSEAAAPQPRSAAPPAGPASQPGATAIPPADPATVQAGGAEALSAVAPATGRSAQAPAAQGSDPSSEGEAAPVTDRLRRSDADRHAPTPENRLSPQARLSPEAGSIAPAERRADGLADPAAGVSASGHAAEPVAPTALPAATLRQIADAVTTGASSLPDPASVRAGAAAASLSAAAQAEGPVRLLTLQLRPAELGQVLVRMRLQDGRLEMSLRAEREETAELLRRDGGLLTALVREAGYQPDLVTVQAGHVPGRDGAGQETLPQAGGQSPPTFGGQQQGGASPDQPTRRQPDAPEEGGRRITEQRDEAHHGDRDRGGLYL